MPRRPATFRQADLVRALRAAKAAGVEIASIRIEAITGDILIVVASNTDTANAGNALDVWLENYASVS